MIAMVTNASGRRTLYWAASMMAAVFSSLLFLGGFHKGYLLVAAVATGVAWAILSGAKIRPALWPVASTAAVTIALGVGLSGMLHINTADLHWPELSARLQDVGLRRFLASLTREYESAAVRAEQALDTALSRERWYAATGRLTAARPERATSLYLNNRLARWSGPIRIEPDARHAPGAWVDFDEFYAVLHVAAASGSTRVVASTLLHAEPPATTFSAPVERVFAQHSAVAGFRVLPPDSLHEGDAAFVAAGDTLATVRLLPLVQGMVRIRIVESSTAWMLLLLSLGATGVLAVVWRRNRAGGLRLLSLGAVLVALSLAPLNALSNRSRVFDPSIFFSGLGGPLTANAGAFAVSAAVVLLGLLTLMRRRAAPASRTAAIVIALVIAGGGPFLLRDLARGITLPSGNVSTALWLSWEVSLFLTACALLLGGLAAGRAVPASWRRLTPAVAALLAVTAAAIGPLVWLAPGRFPGWYPAIWILAIIALVASREGRGSVYTAVGIAALGAATLVWSASVKQRVALAERDISGLSNVDPIASTLLGRFGSSLSTQPSVRDRADLLKRYVNSDLSAAEYPVEIWAWEEDLDVAAMLSLSGVFTPASLLRETMRESRELGVPVLREVRVMPGTQLLLAVPHVDGGLTSVLVAPRTRLLRDDSFLSLLGLPYAPQREPPYQLTLIQMEGEDGTAQDRTRWERRGSELHGDMIVPAPGSTARAHVDVDVRDYDVLLQRGTLVILLDVLILLALWALVLAADAVLIRWVRSTWSVWRQSYRSQLTVALFAFFVVPAVAFALWSQRSIISGDRQIRELLVGQLLRAASVSVGEVSVDALSERFGTPLFLFDGGTLLEASDPLLEQLVPLGRRLPASVFDQLEGGDELTASRVERVGPSTSLIGYQLAIAPASERVVISAPARSDELTIDRRRRDLGVLVLFTTAVGGLAAFWLSGLAARRLAQPIGALRSAALRIARDESAPQLPGQQPAEFVPVFSAFRSMTTDLAASRTALEAARRQTEAILRNVASGVIAFSAEGSITLANPRSSVLLGHRLATGSRLAGVGLDSIDEKVQEFLAGAGEELDFDVVLRGRQMHGSLTRLAAGGGGAVLTLDDVSELARAQRVLAWGQMARQVAHEIKNPLTPIRLGVQHLRRAYGDRQGDYERILESNVGRILAEIDRLDEIARSFSRYGTAPTPQQLARSTDAAEVVRDVVALEKIGQDRVEWQYSEEGEALNAIADADELREVLLNVLENARHADSSRVSVEVRADDGRVTITVRDDGHGIPLESLPQIFEPHFSTRSSGSGLGLAISRKLVEGWGGEIRVDSKEGLGTSVVIRLLGASES